MLTEPQPLNINLKLECVLTQAASADGPIAVLQAHGGVAVPGRVVGLAAQRHACADGGVGVAGVPVSRCSVGPQRQRLAPLDCRGSASRAAAWPQWVPQLGTDRSRMSLPDALPVSKMIMWQSSMHIWATTYGMFGNSETQHSSSWGSPACKLAGSQGWCESGRYVLAGKVAPFLHGFSTNASTAGMTRTNDMAHTAGAVCCSMR